MHSGQKHSSPAFLEWHEPPGSPCGWCGECTAYGNKGALVSFPLSLASRKINESTRKDLGMFANLLVGVVEVEACSAPSVARLVSCQRVRSSGPWTEKWC